MIKNVCIVSINYTIEISPSIKNLASYLNENGYHVSIFTDNLNRTHDFSIQGADIISLNLPNLPQSRRNRDFLTIIKGIYREKRICGKLKSLNEKVDLFISVEADSLRYIEKAGIHLERVCYYFMENTQNINALKLLEPKIIDFLKDCKYYIIQSKERGENVNKDLGVGFDYFYLPVSLRPKPIYIKENPSNSFINLLYSGYFAEWAQLENLILCFNKIDKGLYVRLTLQGHAIGTEYYLNRVKALISELSLGDRVFIVQDYIDDKAYNEFISNFDIGIATYMGEESNWDNLIFSSGKIATYLWSGLAVITNLPDKQAQDIPFLNFGDFSYELLNRQLYKFIYDRDNYKRKALDFANTFYNFDNYAKVILDEFRNCQ